MIEGIKILDFSRVLAGPFVTMILGELGADVIKVEPPGGDETRKWSPIVDGESAYFMSINRNKRSIVINLKDERGKKIIRELVKRTDVVVENFRTGVTKSLGIDYETLSKINPKLVYCSIRGFGEKSPYSHRPAYDIVLQAMSGLMATTGEENRPPIRVSFALFDIISGLIATVTILAALLERERTGKGRHIEVSLYDSSIFGMSYIPMIYLMTGRVPPKMGSAHPSIVPYQAFQCRDGKWLIVAVTNEKFWSNFCKAIGREDLFEDERFRTNPDRVKNRDILIPILNQIIKTKDREEWMKIFEEYGVPYGPVYELNEVFEDLHVKSSGIVTELDHETLDKVKQIQFPALIDGARPKPKSAPPALGSGAKEILNELGYSDDFINFLAEEGVICCV